MLRDHVVGVEVRAVVEGPGSAVAGLEPEGGAVHCARGHASGSKSFGEQQSAVAAHGPAPDAEPCRPQTLTCEYGHELISDHRLRVFTVAAAMPVAVVPTVDGDKSERRCSGTNRGRQKGAEVMAPENVLVTIAAAVKDEKKGKRHTRSALRRVTD